MGNWRWTRIQVNIPQNQLNELRSFIIKNSCEIFYDDKSNEEIETMEIFWDKNIEYHDYKYGDHYEMNTIDLTTTEKVFLEFFKLGTPSICGICDWANESDIDVIGTIGKDASNEEIMMEWTFIAAKFPDISGEIHICGDYECEKCVAKVVLDNGRVYWKPPTLKTITPDTRKCTQNLFNILMQHNNKLNI